jgi:hypothetical protein
MNWLAKFARRLRMLIHRQQFDADLEEEMRLHLELRQEEQLQSGMTADEARAAARRGFGNTMYLKEESHIAWGWEWFENLGHSELFEQVSAIWPVSTALTGGERVERIEMLGTSPSYFELLGANASLGTVYKQADWVPGFLDGVVISDGLWKRSFGADPRVIGRRVRVDEDGYTIIGVMPADFRHPGKTLNGDVEMYPSIIR